MQLQHYQFGLSPARLVWLDTQHGAAAPNLESLIVEAGKEAKKGLTEAEQKALDEALKDLAAKQAEKHTTVIHWSVRERARFAQELSASIAANQNFVDTGVQRASVALGIDLDARVRDLASKVGVTLETGSVKKVATISDTIQREVEHELHQTAVDAAAKNYIDADNSPMEQDANSARQIIDNAYRAAVKTLDAKQRAALSVFVQSQATAAYETDKEGQPSFFLKKKVDYREANAIADAIRQEAEKIKKGVNTPVTPSITETAPRASAPDKKTPQLFADAIKVEPWANDRDPKNPQQYRKLGYAEEASAVVVRQDKDFKPVQESIQAIAQAHQLDGNKAVDALVNLVAIKPVWFNDRTEYLKQQLKTLTDRFDGKTKELDTFLKLRGIDKSNADLLVRYVVFGDVKEDITKFDNYVKTPDGQKVARGEVAPIAHTAETQNVREESDQDKKDRESQVKVASAKKEFDDAWKKNPKDWGTILSAGLGLAVAMFEKFTGKFSTWFDSLGSSKGAATALISQLPPAVQTVLNVKPPEAASTQPSASEVIKASLKGAQFNLSDAHITTLNTVKTGDFIALDMAAIPDTGWQGIPKDQVVKLKNYLSEKRFAPDEVAKTQPLLTVLTSQQATLFPAPAK